MQTSRFCRRAGWTHTVLLLAAIYSGLPFCRAAEVIPPVPSRYFNDYAHVVASGTADQLNRTLEDFERQTSDQILVAVFPKMQSDSSIEDYTVRVAQAWKVGQKGKDNGAVLFVFLQDRKMYLQVGYGLEGALPDAIAKQIIDLEIKPRFRTGDFAGGLTAGVRSILAAVRGEYKGSGRTVAEGQRPPLVLVLLFPFLVFTLIVVVIIAGIRRSGAVYRRGGYGPWTNPSWGSGGGGFWSSGGGGSSWSSGGGGGFSSGGGSFGGGGAGGSW